MTERAVVIGQGYVGLPVAISASEAGFDVVGFELDPAKVASLNDGRSHVEDITDDRLRAAIDSGRYRASRDEADLAGFDFAVISVPTPMHEGAPDLSYIESASRTLAPALGRSDRHPRIDHLSRHDRGSAAPLLEAGSGLKAGVDFHLGYSPERIDPGNATYRLENTPKVVSGVDEDSLARVKYFFDRFVERTVPVSGTCEAELTKLLENTFRHVNIALVNELAMFANDLGIDVWEAIDAASTKPFGYMRFTPGPGVGGHCLPIDPSYLSWQIERRLGQTFRFVELANDVNSHMPDYVVRRVQHLLNERERSVKGSRILVLGLAYKANTGDARETPSIPICTTLAELGAQVTAVDPHVAERQFPPQVARATCTPEVLGAADLVLFLVDHAEFEPAMVTGAGRPVLDCRHRLTGDNVIYL